MKTKTETSVQKNDWKTMLIDLEKKIDKFVNKKTPALPNKVKEMIVKYGPYLILVMMMYAMYLLGFGLGLTPFAFMGGFRVGFSFIISIIFYLITIILEIMALPALFKRQIKGWKILFYLSLLTVLSNLISLNLASLIIGTAISWYFLFQIKSYYK
jgi:hypothetical protein